VKTHWNTTIISLNPLATPAATSIHMETMVSSKMNPHHIRTTTSKINHTFSPSLNPPRRFYGNATPMELLRSRTQIRTISQYLIWVLTNTARTSNHPYSHQTSRLMTSSMVNELVTSLQLIIHLEIHSFSSRKTISMDIQRIQENIRN